MSALQVDTTWCAVVDLWQFVAVIDYAFPQTTDQGPGCDH
jgi:hypothetical protein